jgi:hypothetical protein
MPSVALFRGFLVAGCGLSLGRKAANMVSGDTLNAVVALVVGAITIFVQFWLHWDARKRVSFSRSVSSFFPLLIFVVAVAAKFIWQSPVAQILFLLYLILVIWDFYRYDLPLDRREIALFVMSVAFTLILLMS